MRFYQHYLVKHFHLSQITAIFANHQCNICFTRLGFFCRLCRFSRLVPLVGSHFDTAKQPPAARTSSPVDR
ncbi:hypothetical protein RP20_CCG021587 [Aedes albopictus]|nr:hypothetical protein RP20_CCG021587 [Aedes albopictus]